MSKMRHSIYLIEISYSSMHILMTKFYQLVTVGSLKNKYHPLLHLARDLFPNDPFKLSTAMFDHYIKHVLTLTIRHTHKTM